MSTAMIILAGGVGVRIGQPIPKQLILLGGKPIIMHVLEKVEQLKSIDKLVIVCPREHLSETDALLKHRNFRMEYVCIEGGETRQESTYRGLLEVRDFDSVVVHEAVRPFVTVEQFRSLMDCEFENAIYGAPIPFTVLKGHDVVEEVLERRDLVNVQLPQKFNAAMLLDAHEKARAEGLEFTEDASVFHRYFTDPVHILPGSELNIKITHPVDLIIGEAIYSEYVLGRE